jgi:hypothetical protein
MVVEVYGGGGGSSFSSVVVVGGGAWSTALNAIPSACCNVS